MRSKEDVISIIRSYCLANDGDEATTDLLLAVGAEILGVSAEEMQKRLAWSDRESDVPDQEGGREQDRFTKRLSDGQVVMDCQKCEADWTAKHGKPLEQCTALYCRNRCKDRLADYEDAETIVPISDKVCPKEVGPAKQLGRCVLLDWDTLNGQMLRDWSMETFGHHVEAYVGSLENYPAESVFLTLEGLRKEDFAAFKALHDEADADGLFCPELEFSTENVCEMPCSVTWHILSKVFAAACGLQSVAYAVGTDDGATSSASTWGFLRAFPSD